MDEPTRRYYERHCEQVADRQLGVPSPLAAYFGVAFPRGSRVLDLGAGAGRDMVALVREGYTAWGVEPSAPLRAIALGRDPGLRDRLVNGALPDTLPSLKDLGGPFDGVVCSAVLQHVPRSSLFDAVFNIRGLLKERGRVLISVPSSRTDVTGERDADGRLFNGVSPDEFELLFERTGFVSIGRWDEDDAHGRAGVRWNVLLLELRAAGAARPIDLIESVLSRHERKVATYKFALIRALCSIALTEPHVVRFSSDAVVRVPLRAIAERWIDFYWPLFEGRRLLPQMNGERRARCHKLAFAKELKALIDHYQPSGQLTAFVLKRRGAVLEGDSARLHARLLAKLQRTIRDGPVKHAGGSGERRLFDYDDGDVLVAAPLWREISLMGHWIQDALVLRWAEHVAGLSKGDVSTALVVTRLLKSATSAREQDDAREVYGSRPDLECVWTGRTLTPPRFAVDHAIPYSLWHNNDLWNLLPTHPAVNAEKSDLIPATALLRRRRDAIFHCWSITRAEFPRRFANEARMQLGAYGDSSDDTRDAIDFDRLFERLVESAEVTALQRASPRWHPAA